VARWSDLTEGLVSATVTGRDHSEFEGRSRQCDLIEISYATSRRTLCVDRARRLILRERMESLTPGAPQPQHVETITYSRVEYLRAQSAEVFQFHPPPGSSQGGLDLPLTGEGGSGNYAGSLRPTVISKTEPQYTPEARTAKLQGSVMLSLTVDERGLPHEIKVIRGLGMGLDEKAIEAVANWRFQPGTRGGQPVATFTQVKVDFRNP
jgi:TonB family protein